MQYLSFPRNSPDTPSVNFFINSDDFPTEWGTFSAASALILSLPPGCTAATFDISSAYRLVPVRPAQQNHCCVLWEGKVYVDRAVCFGCRSSAGIFGAVADMLVAIYNAYGYGPLIKWVDNFLVIWLPLYTHSEDDFIHLTGQHGVPWSLVKKRLRAIIQRYIGFDWNLAERSVSFPEEKLTALQSLLATWLETGVRFSASDAAHLHGKLVHACSIYILIRPFLRSLARFAASYKSYRALLHPPSVVVNDLRWTTDLLSRLPNELPLAFPTPFDIGWFGDASSSFGVGVVVGNFWAAWRWADGFSVGPDHSHDIGWAEAVAVELGLHLAIRSNSLTCLPPHTARVLVRSDNAGVTAVVNKGRSRSKLTNDTLQSIYCLLADLGLTLQAEHVASEDNISDPLSRGDLAAFFAHFCHPLCHVPFPLPSHLQGKLISL